MISQVFVGCLCAADNSNPPGCYSGHLGWKRFIRVSMSVSGSYLFSQGTQAETVPRCCA